ncbi:MAG: hypothetical protein KDD92_06570, partial [Caldilineaceae bacterium]|nr:hypothetical protein [Caldilineaceae bacterium]
TIARYLTPEIGHFISPDAIVPGPLRVDAYNRYMYALGNPLKYNDPSGHVVEPTGGTSACGTFSCGKGIITKLAGEKISRLLFAVSEFMEEPTLEASAILSHPMPTIIDKIILNQVDGTQSLDLGVLNTSRGAGGRGSLSLARDNGGSFAVLSSEGFAGGTPASFIGLSMTATNAPSVQHLAGDSVQVGGSLEEGVGVFGEITLFADPETGQIYHGATIGPAGTYPDALPGSIHGSWEHTQILVSIDLQAFYDNVQRLYFGKDTQQ